MMFQTASFLRVYDWVKNLEVWVKGVSASNKWVLDTVMLLKKKKKLIVKSNFKKNKGVHMLMLRFQGSKIWHNFASFLYNGFHVLLVGLSKM